MKLKYYYDLLTGKTDASNPAKLTLRNILAVAQSWFRRKKKEINLGGFNLPTHIWEQVVWRRVQVKEISPKCWEEGVCKVCGCDVIDKTLEDRACEGTCYPEMFHGEQEWKEYKQLNKIKLFE